MRNLFLITAAMVLLGGGTSVAQVAPSPGVTAPMRAPVSGSPLTPSPRAVGSPLGSIQLNLGSQISASGLGTITTCPAAGIANAAPNFPVDATDPTGAGASQFGTPALACGAALPPSSAGIVTGATFSDGAIPLAATEAGGPGMSPLIAVPPASLSASSCSSGLTMPETSGLPTPPDSAGC
jgi:hypothetical protein